MTFERGPLMSHRFVADFIYVVGGLTTGARYIGILSDWQDKRRLVPFWKAVPFIHMVYPIALAWPLTFPIMEVYSRYEKQ